MTGRPTFILHIGPHKTGTTYLQLSFKAQRPGMEARGILYPAKWDYAPGNPSHLPLVQALRAGDRDSLAPEFARLIGSGAQMILLSAEDMSNLDVAALTLLKSLMDGCPVRIVFYFRRWSELVPSAWQESIKHGQRWTFPEFMLMTIQNVGHARLLNFDHKLAPFVSVFGADALRLASYSELRDREMDIFVHFAANFLDWPDAVPGGAPRESNSSRDLPTTELLRAMNAFSGQLPGAAAGADRLWRKFDKLADRAFLAPVFSAIARHTRTQRFHDGAPTLHALHEKLAATYHEHIVPPKRRRVLFQPKVREIAYVGGDYLAEPGVGETLHALYDLLMLDGR